MNKFQEILIALRHLWPPLLLCVMFIAWVIYGLVNAPIITIECIDLVNFSCNGD